MGFDTPGFWDNFWPNFWSSVLADVFVGIILVWAITWLNHRVNKADVHIVAEYTTLSNGSVAVDFFIRNPGRVAFASGEIYWSVLWDSEAVPLASFGDHKEVTTFQDGATEIGGKKYRLYNGMTRGPVFPGRKLHLFMARGRRPKDEDFNLYYSLSTAHGYFPAPAGWLQRGRASVVGLWNRLLRKPKGTTQTRLESRGKMEVIDADAVGASRLDAS